MIIGTKIKKRKPKRGDIRIVRKFLWLPVTISGETRWLEKVKLKQKFTKNKEWENVEFLPYYYYGTFLS